MPKIHPLPPHIISRIAAGEVIERPAYVVKELIENAIDAQATYITIAIEAAGLKKIVVTDNGEGMSQEDIATCFQPHTTSKILTAEDLLDISSLGFRGEALSSIVAIADMTITSRTADAVAGTRVEIRGGNVTKLAPVGMPVGTSVSTSHVFHTVPARKKFLKSARTEFRHIVDIVSRYALAFPHIRFFLSHDKKIILDVPAHQTILQRVQMLLGNDIFQELIPVEYSDTFFSLSGFLSRPHITTHTTNKQFVFINTRYVVDKTIALAVKEAYGSLLAATSYPIFLLSLTLPYEHVDVNVHPRKELVNFLNPSEILAHVTKTVTESLSQYSSPVHLSLGDASPGFGNTHSFAGKLLKETVVPWQVKNVDQLLPDSDVLQLNTTYLITQTTQGILLIDQHAAHERILFEQFTSEFRKQKKKQEIFQLPQTMSLHVSVSDAIILQEQKETLSSLGFTLDNFSGTTFTLRTIPVLFQGRNIQLLIQELLADISQEKNIKDIDKQSQKMIAYLSCRAAMKAGEKLTKEEAKKLIQQLEKTPHNITCPHGRPTKIVLTKESLDRMFKRK